MSLIGPITNALQRRADGLAIRRIALATPAKVVFRCQVATSVSNTSYAEFAWVNTLAGSYADVREGQVIVVSKDVAMKEVVMRTRARKVPSASTIFISYTALPITANDYVTVLDAYDVVEKVERITTNGDIFKDYDLTFRRLPPVVRNLQASYVVASATSGSIAFAAQAQAMAKGATISGWAWDVADGTIVVGNATLPNVTVTFPNGHRWVSLTVVDSVGTSLTYRFEVWVVDWETTPYALPVDAVTVEGSWDQGWVATLAPFAAASEVMTQTRITIASEWRYGDGTREIKVDFVGQVQRDSALLSGDAEAGVAKEADLQVYGLGALLQRVAVPSARITRKANPTSWGEMDGPTPARVLTYALAWHTTALQLMAVEWDVADADHESDDVDLQKTSALEAIRHYADRYNALPIFSPSGQMVVKRHACYLSETARNALPVVTTIGKDDIVEAEVMEEGADGVGSLLMPALHFTPATGKTKPIIARCPTVMPPYATDDVTGPNQLLPNAMSEAAARDELRHRAGCHYAWVNRRLVAEVTLTDGYADLTPAVDRWYGLALSAAEDLLGRDRSGRRWLLQALSTRSVAEEGTCEVRGTFVAETKPVAAHLMFVDPPGDLPYNSAPPSAPYPMLDDPWIGSGDPFPLRDMSLLRPNAEESAVGCKTVLVPMWANVAVALGFTPQSTKQYSIRITGQAFPVSQTYDLFAWATNGSNPIVPPPGWGFTSSLGYPALLPWFPGYGVYIGGPSYQTAMMTQTYQMAQAAYVDQFRWLVQINGTPTVASPVTIRAKLGSVVVAELVSSIPPTGGYEWIVLQADAIADRFEVEAGVTQTFCLINHMQTKIVGKQPVVVDAFYTADLGNGTVTPHVTPQGINMAAMPAFSPSGEYNFELMGNQFFPSVSFLYTTTADIPRTYLNVRVCPRG